MSKETKAPEWADFFVNRVVWGLIVMVILWISITYYGPSWMLSRLNKDNMAAYGQVGDMFGMVNSLFSGLAFLAAIYAVILQTVEMREAGERRLEEENQQTEQMKIARESLGVQLKMREDDRRKQIIDCFRKTHRDALELLAVCDRIANKKIYIGRDQRPTVSGVDETATLHMAKMDLLEDTLSLTLLLGDPGEAIAGTIHRLLKVADGPEMMHEKVPELSEVFKLIGKQFEDEWKKLKEGSA